MDGRHLQCSDIQVRHSLGALNRRLRAVLDDSGNDGNPARRLLDGPRCNLSGFLGAQRVPLSGAAAHG